MENRINKYLSSRVIFIAILLTIGSLITVLTSLYFYKHNIFSFLPTLFNIVLLLILVIGFFCIFIPFKKVENDIFKNIKEHVGDNIIKETEQVSFSPATAKLMSQEITFLSQAQLFELNKRQAQYLALQNQINPHFLYNTLESIRSEALIADLNSVADMTEALALFFRYTISKVENLVSVEEELKNSETYFSIQQYRFGDRLCLDINYKDDDRDKILRCRIPKLTLQPILENAILHGTEQKLGTGHLTIDMELTDRRLLINITDDGVGIDAKTLAEINSSFGRASVVIAEKENKKGGLALVNVSRRIRLLFGDEYGLHVYSLKGQGTSVEISLPIITSDKDVKNSEVLK